MPAFVPEVPPEWSTWILAALSMVPVVGAVPLAPLDASLIRHDEVLVVTTLPLAIIENPQSSLASRFRLRCPASLGSMRKLAEPSMCTPMDRCWAQPQWEHLTTTRPENNDDIDMVAAVLGPMWLRKTSVGNWGVRSDVVCIGRIGPTQ